MGMRNHVAVVATFRNSAGSMKHKVGGRGGSRNAMREFLNDWQMDSEDVTLPAMQASEPEMDSEYRSIFE